MNFIYGGAFKKTKSGLRSRRLSTLTGPRRPSVPRPTLAPDWHAWSYITSSDSPDATSSAELSARGGEERERGKPLSPNKKPKQPVCHRHTFVLNSSFLSLCIDSECDPGSLNDLQHGEETSVAKRLCLCRLVGSAQGKLWVATGGEERWEDVGRTVVVWHEGCGWTLALLGWLGENITLNSPAPAGFYRVRVKEGESDYYGSWNSIIREREREAVSVCVREWALLSSYLEGTGG